MVPKGQLTVLSHDGTNCVVDHKVAYQNNNCFQFPLISTFSKGLCDITSHITGFPACDFMGREADFLLSKPRVEWELDGDLEMELQFFTAHLITVMAGSDDTKSNLMVAMSKHEAVRHADPYRALTSRLTRMWHRFAISILPFCLKGQSRECKEVPSLHFNPRTVTNWFNWSLAPPSHLWIAGLDDMVTERVRRQRSAKIRWGDGRERGAQDENEHTWVGSGMWLAGGQWTGSELEAWDRSRSQNGTEPRFEGAEPAFHCLVKSRNQYHAAGKK